MQTHKFVSFPTIEFFTSDDVNYTDDRYTNIDNVSGTEAMQFHCNKYQILPNNTTILDMDNSNSPNTFKYSPLSHNIKRMDNSGLNIWYVPEILDTPKLKAISEETVASIDSTDSDSDSSEAFNELYKTNMFVYCIHCASMIMIMTNDKVPFSILSNKNVDGKCIILGTTCRQCTKKYGPLLQANNDKKQQTGYSFDRSFKMANISSAILETSHVCKIARLAVKRQVTIMKDDDNCLLYEKRNTILDEMNDKCYVIGIRTDDRTVEQNDDIFMVFLPGGFF